MRFADPAAQHSRLQGRVKRPRVDTEDSDNVDQEDRAVEGSVDENDGSIVDPVKVKQPIANLVSSALATAWQVNRNHRMCFIFDAVSPACRFKRGMLYNEVSDFPKDTLDGDITETDGPDPGWMPVDPPLVQCVWKHLAPHRHTNSPWHIG